MGFITIVTATLVFNKFLVSQRMSSKRESEREREKNKVLLMVAMPIFASPILIYIIDPSGVHVSVEPTHSISLILQKGVVTAWAPKHM